MTKACGSWAVSVGAEVVWRPGTGLNGAVRSGVDHLREAGFDRVIVAHGDLPRAGSLAPLGDWPGITLVPDRRNDGTNVIALPSGCPFAFSYGQGSFARHLGRGPAAGAQPANPARPGVWTRHRPSRRPQRTGNEGVKSQKQAQRTGDVRTRGRAIWPPPSGRWPSVRIPTTSS